MDLSQLFGLAQTWLPPLGRRVVGPAPSDRSLVDLVRQRAGELRQDTDDSLKADARTLATTLRANDAHWSADHLVQAFALAYEAVRRVHSKELYSEQILAGILLAHGTIAELETGEGKTLSGVAPAVLLGLTGQGVHVATPNAYLAERDYELLLPVYQLLGVTSGLLTENAPAEAKRAAYACDITYGTGYEFGFDYLREQLAQIHKSRDTLGQRFHEMLRGMGSTGPEWKARRGVAIIDEIDSVLIDEACMPLILSEGGPSSGGDAALFVEALRVADRLREDVDYVIDPESHAVTLTEPGKARSHAEAAIPSAAGLQRSWTIYIQQALQSRLMIVRDIDYVVDDGKVVIVDGSTGRLCPDRTWSDGLHQMLEAKENLTSSGEQRTAARITRQRYFRMYDTLCGMTGTAVEAQREFWKTYELRVVTVPPRLPTQRRALPSRYFLDMDAKWRAVVEDIQQVHATPGDPSWSDRERSRTASGWPPISTKPECPTSF